MPTVSLTPIDMVMPEKRIVVFAPHYDDALFLLGNCALAWRAEGIAKQVRVLLLFSRSNYLQGTGAGNYDTGLARQKLATGHRVLEDAECLDALLGRFQYQYELVGESECFVRAKPFANDEMEFPHGMFPDFDDEDWRIFTRMKVRILEWAGQEDTALVFPLAIKEHIDHFIVREAAVQAAAQLGSGAKASFYFQEDKPYGGIASAEELARVEQFVAAHPFERRVYRAEPERIVDLAFTHYPSQVEELYRDGICGRANKLRGMYGLDVPCDQLYRYMP